MAKASPLPYLRDVDPAAGEWRLTLGLSHADANGDPRHGWSFGKLQTNRVMSPPSLARAIAWIRMATAGLPSGGRLV